MPSSPEPRSLYTVRAGTSTFRLVTHKAGEALAHVADMHERGLEDVHVVDANGMRYDEAALRALAEAEQGSD